MKMTPAEIDSYNASYFKIPVGWMPIHNQHMNMPTNQWPESLQQLAKETAKRIGWSGDVAACTVAKWIRQEKKAGRL